jgi:hypothetical protein
MNAFLYVLIVVGKVVAVHVAALQIAAVVTSHHAVWIDHRDHPSVKTFSELLHEQVLSQQLVHKAVDYEAAVSFARVLAANHQDNRLIVILLKFLIHAADLDERNVEATQA